MVIRIPERRRARTDEQRDRQLVHSILSGITSHRLHVAVVACWMDRQGRISPAHVLPEVA